MGEWLYKSTSLNEMVCQKECSSSVWTNITLSQRHVTKRKKLSVKRYTMYISKK